jgi:hypothetical protein
MATSEHRFESTRDPEAVLAEVAALAAEKGWRIEEQAAGTIVVKRPLNWKTWGDRIAVHARRDEGVPTVVDVRTSSWQLIDWGAGKQLIADVQDRVA